MQSAGLIIFAISFFDTWYILRWFWCFRVLINFVYTLNQYRSLTNGCKTVTQGMTCYMLFFPALSTACFSKLQCCSVVLFKRPA